MQVLTKKDSEHNYEHHPEKEGSVMELECLKFNEKMPSEGAHCRHLEGYCKYRTSCIIYFIEKENKALRTSQEGAQENNTSGEVPTK